MTLKRSGPPVRLSDRATAADRPEVSRLTADIEDVALDNLLRRITRYGYRYIGLVATDVKDEIFLADRLRHMDPDVIIFTVQSNLLYANPRAPTTAMFGSLAVSSFPLISRGSRPPHHEVPRPQQEKSLEPPARQFASEAQEGVFLAVQCLLGERIEAPPRVWIAAAGNTSMAPLARIASVDPGKSAPSRFPCYTYTYPSPTVRAARESGNLPILFSLVFLVWLGTVLVMPPYLPRFGARPSPLLACAALILYTMAGGILVLIRLPAIEPSYFANGQLVGSLERILQVASLLALVFFALVLSIGMGLVADRASVSLARRALSVLALMAAFLPIWPPAEKWIVARWTLGDPGLFYLRVRGIANGLSPLLPLELALGALLAWLFIEMKRQPRHKISWPVPADEPALAGCRGSLTEIARLCRTVFPHNWKYLLLLAATVLTTLVPFWKATQPIGEPASYGRIFLCWIVLVLLLSGASFFRFASCWHHLRHVLIRLEHCACRRSFERIAPVVSWNPMRSFAWNLPSFRTLVFRVEALRRLARRSELAWLLERLPDIERDLSQVYEYEGTRDGEREASARQRVEEALRAAARDLASHGRQREAQELDALAIVTYLRVVFSHLRYSLMGAMIPSLILIAAVSFYTFVPRHYLLLFLWTMVAMASAVSLGIFVHMDRDVVLSWIGSSHPGRVTLDREFLSNILTYAILPLVALVTSQVPGVAELLGRWLEPLARILETT